MGRKIFVSYKHNDPNVEPLYGSGNKTTVRNYVDELEELLEAGDHIYRGEESNDDLSGLGKKAIRRRLAEKLFDSTVTIVLISRSMKTRNKKEYEQWIPWEISYSLKNIERGGLNSRVNAIFAVVIPNRNGKYDYLITDRRCSSCGDIRHWKREMLFPILRDNMFNRKKPNIKTCSKTSCGGYNLEGHSYIETVKWEEFVGNVDGCIIAAIAMKGKMASYDITRDLSDEVL